MNCYVTTMENKNMKDRIIEELKKVYDPEISINIYDLGLIYDIDITNAPKVAITHTP